MSASPLPFVRCLKKIFVFGSFACLGLSVTSTSLMVVSHSAFAQQMELRENEKYDAKAFAQAKPAVGEMAPNMKLKTFEGKEVALDSYRGKNIVVIKAGYT